ncbi:MAG TPA: tyrosine-type recombinase/integrase [Thermoguttaceae bacterium]|nr:tyrosine-type recombinase/integrase [Thermoguttaceae bacterium]
MSRKRKIKVSAVWYEDRGKYVLRWKDRLGKCRTETTDLERRCRANQTAAGKLAAAKEDELLSAIREIPWEEFLVRYEEEKLIRLKPSSRKPILRALIRAGEWIEPLFLSDITAERVSAYLAHLDGRGLAADTVAAHATHLRAALRWAAKLGLLDAAPTIDPPEKAKSDAMKGRPITEDEYQRMLAETAAVVGEAAGSAWRAFLRFLWWSGLRLGEALALHWDTQGKLSVDTSGATFRLHLPGELQKSRRTQLLPLAPEAVEFLKAIPAEKRLGHVFQLPGCGRAAPVRRIETASRIISRIGERAGIVVEVHPQTGRKKHASAHDLRRSFGERWSHRVMPRDLMVLMRHESIDTTMKFYRSREAADVEVRLWAAYEAESVGNISVTSGSKNAVFP